MLCDRRMANDSREFRVRVLQGVKHKVSGRQRSRADNDSLAS